MKHLTESLYKGYSTQYSEISNERKTASYKNDYEIGFAQERLFYLKIQAIIDELSQMMVFIRELGKL